MARSKTATAEAIFWQAIEAFALRARTTSLDRKGRPTDVTLARTNWAANAQQTPQYQVGGFPITPHQMSVLKPSAKIKEEQRVSRQRTMDASRGAVYPDPGLANTGY